VEQLETLTKLHSEANDALDNLNSKVLEKKNTLNHHEEYLKEISKALLPVLNRMDKNWPLRAEYGQDIRDVYEYLMEVRESLVLS
jgi:DNA repair ATPase RecN